ncbi:MAG: uL14 family ribosomal protein [Candidatus Micrarchaeota archaeon]|nr:uL14 family ribosomal protein [Candidatus Micrarchaeota archaeon]
MKGLGTRVIKGLQTGSTMVCNDNSGAKVVAIIGVKGAKAKRAMCPKVGISDIVTVAVKKGTPAMKKKVLKAVIVRQRQSFRRPNAVRFPKVAAIAASVV